MLEASSRSTSPAEGEALPLPSHRGGRCGGVRHRVAHGACCPCPSGRSRPISSPVCRAGLCLAGRSGARSSPRHRGCANGGRADGLRSWTDAVSVLDAGARNTGATLRARNGGRRDRHHHGHSRRRSRARSLPNPANRGQPLKFVNRRIASILLLLFVYLRGFSAIGWSDGVMPQNPVVSSPYSKGIPPHVYANQ